MNDIITDFEEDQNPADGGVERTITAEEEYVAHGERVERTTELALLEDGGVHISQRIPGCHDTLTLASDVLWKLRWESRPPRDGGDESGLYPKYEVFTDGEPVDGAFVLEPDDDPAARKALATYALATDDEKLSEDLHAWLNEIEDDEDTMRLAGETDAPFVSSVELVQGPDVPEVPDGGEDDGE